MLMEEKEDKARIYAGWAMSRRLLVVLGPRRAWKIMEVLTEARIPESVSPQDTGRRNFLSVMGATAVSAIALMIPGVSRADEGSTHRTFLPMVGAENDNNSIASFLEYDLPSPEMQEAFRQKAYDSGKFELFLEKTLSEYDHLSPDEDDDIPRVFIVNDRVIVQYSIEGGAGYSGYEIHFDQTDGRLVETRSALFTNDEEGNIRTRFFMNDDLRLDAVFNGEGKMLHGQAFDDNGNELDMTMLQGVAAQAVTVDWACINNCLTGLGIPTWLLTVLGLICGVICVGTAGLGCYACFAGAGYGFYLEAFYCVDLCCNHCLIDL